YYQSLLKTEIVIYKKNIPVIQPVNTKKFRAQKPKTSITFFPEGGNLVNNIKSVVAFKANTKTGKPVKIKGLLFNNKGKILDSISSVHDGMGSFTLTPIPNETYYVQWMDEWNTKYKSILPTANEEGIVMNVVQQEYDKLNVQLHRQENATNEFKQLRVVATMHKNMVYRSNVKLVNNTNITVPIPIAHLPTGVLQITIFNVNWLPIAERIFFVKTDNYESLVDARIFKPNTTKKAKNNLEISIPDEMLTNISVAITDAGLTESEDENIISSLLLTSDIKGKVYNPLFYFSNNADSTKQFLDLVMQTHGWRKLKWMDIAQNKTPEITYPKDSAYVSVAGKVFGANASQLRQAQSLNVFVKTKDSATKFLSLPLQPDGSFVQKDFIFFDTVTVMYQFNKYKDLSYSTAINFSNLLLNSENKINIDSLYSYNDKEDTIGNAKKIQLWEQQKKLAKLSQSTTLDDVVVTTKTKKPEDKLDAQYATGFFQGGDAYQFDMESNRNSAAISDVLTYLTGRIAGLTITHSGNPPKITWRGGTPGLYLNEMLVDAATLQEIYVSDVAYIKVIKPPFFGGMGGSGSAGAIAVYTKKGKNSNENNFKGLDKKRIAGYTAIREFYSPDYDMNPELRQEKDIRTTIYWNPYVILTSQNRTVLLNFFNNDVTKKFRLSIQGMNEEGKLISIHKIIE
ncbi:MAG TPA: hypothetical protein PKJ70_01545, partial [Chitinophagaceae bacterium]|nr:hypothetical protein [Chitinophagaceae bacterium]